MAAVAFTNLRTVTSEFTLALGGILILVFT
jgi:hypothetical protein